MQLNFQPPFYKLKARNLETGSIALFPPFQSFPSIRSNRLLLARARNFGIKFHVETFVVGKQEDVPVREFRVVVVECHGVKSRRKSGKLNSQRRERRVGWKRLGKITWKRRWTTLRFRFYTKGAMLVKRQDSHLLSFQRGVGNRGKNMAEPECLMESMIDNVGGSLKRNLVPSFAILIWDLFVGIVSDRFLMFGGDKIDDQWDWRMFEAKSCFSFSYWDFFLCYLRLFEIFSNCF